MCVCFWRPFDKWRQGGRWHRKEAAKRRWNQGVMSWWSRKWKCECRTSYDTLGYGRYKKERRLATAQLRKAWTAFHPHNKNIIAAGGGCKTFCVGIQFIFYFFPVVMDQGDSCQVQVLTTRLKLTWQGWVVWIIEKIYYRKRPKSQQRKGRKRISNWSRPEHRSGWRTENNKFVSERFKKKMSGDLLPWIRDIKKTSKKSGHDQCQILFAFLKIIWIAAEYCERKCRQRRRREGLATLSRSLLAWADLNGGGFALPSQ